MIIDELFTEENVTKPISKPYFIAEAGVNHEGSMELAKRLINEAKEGGADAIKFQTYKASTIAAKNSPSYWDLSKEPTKNQFELFSKYDSFWKKEYIELKEYCDKVDITFLSTPFDKESAIFLNDLMPLFKISSSDLTNKPFIELMCDFNKPILLSTGASNLDEIKESVLCIKNKGNKLSLLHCILNYPTTNENANLGMLLDLKRNFPETLLGYSDHTLASEIQNLEYATVLGAKIIEKHFTFDKTLPGNDHYHSFDKDDLKKYNTRIDNLISSIGSTNKFALESEEPARKNARRSLISLNPISKGEVISEEHLTWKRPAFGISPKEIDKLIGKKAINDIKEDEILYWNMFE